MQAPANQQQQAAQVQATAIAVATAPMAHVNRQPHALHKTIVHLTAWSVMVATVLILNLVMPATTALLDTPVTPVKILRLVFLMVPQSVLRIHNVPQEATVNSLPTHAKVVVAMTMTALASAMARRLVGVTQPTTAQIKASVTVVMSAQAMQTALVVQSVHKTIVWNV